MSADIRTTMMALALLWTCSCCCIGTDGPALASYNARGWPASQSGQSADIAIIGDVRESFGPSWFEEVLAWREDVSSAREGIAATLGELSSRGEIDGVFMLGDLVPNGSSQGAWDRFAKRYRDVLQNVPCYAIPGNHEYYTDHLATSFRRHLRAPDGSSDSTWFSLPVAGCLFIFLDTNRSELGRKSWEAQIRFLRQTVDATTLDHIYLLVHHPPLARFGMHAADPNARELIQVALSSMNGGRVRGVFASHNHNGEVFLLGATLEAGPGELYQGEAKAFCLVTGGGGAPADPIHYDPVDRYPVYPPAFDRLMRSMDGEEFFHFVRLRIDGAHHSVGIYRWRSGTGCREVYRLEFDGRSWSEVPASGRVAN